MTTFALYIHIPFCKSRCIYCDFFSSTQLERREEYVQAVIKEAQQRITHPAEIQTVYFGGGTPSMLAVEQIQRILAAVRPTNAVEITLEANPGDLTTDKLQALRAIGINRLSIGIQSFRDEELRLIGRRHSADQAREVVHLAQEAGFDNISIDLMYALPNQTMEDWKYNINEALKLKVQHISCYCLTYESGTRLAQLVDEGTITPADEDLENAMYDTLCKKLQESGYKHYEVSNFSISNRHSRHNSAHWDNTPYIGLGAGAHSYDGTNRRWNEADLDAYLKHILNGSQYWEEETLTPDQKSMEHIMLGLRTSNGIPATSDLLAKALPFLNNGQLCIKNDRLVATQSGLHILNRLIEALV